MIRIGECSEHFTVTGQSSHSLALSEKEKINIRINSRHCMTGNRITTPKRKSGFGENFRCLWVIFWWFLLSLFHIHKFTKNNYPYFGLEKTSVNVSCIFITKTRHPHSTWLQRAATWGKLTVCIVEAGKNFIFF